VIQIWRSWCFGNCHEIRVESICALHDVDRKRAVRKSQDRPDTRTVVIAALRKLTTRCGSGT